MSLSAQTRSWFVILCIELCTTSQYQHRHHRRRRSSSSLSSFWLWWWYAMSANDIACATRHDFANVAPYLPLFRSSTPSKNIIIIIILNIIIIYLIDRQCGGSPTNVPNCTSNGQSKHWLLINVHFSFFFFFVFYFYSYFSVLSLFLHHVSSTHTHIYGRIYCGFANRRKHVLHMHRRVCVYECNETQQKK